MPVMALVMPGPGTMQITPGRPVLRAAPSAIDEAEARASLGGAAERPKLEPGQDQSDLEDEPVEEDGTRADYRQKLEALRSFPWNSAASPDQMQDLTIWFQAAPAEAVLLAYDGLIDVLRRKTAEKGAKDVEWLSLDGLAHELGIEVDGPTYRAIVGFKRLRDAVKAGANPDLQEVWSYLRQTQRMIRYLEQ